MISVGETLRRERLRRNLDLEQISHELKISPKFLDAIEEERFDRLPGGVFAKSFVRQYARLMGLDEEELAGEVGRIVDPGQTAAGAPEAPRQPPAEIHVPRVEAWQSGGESSFSWSSTLPALALVVVVMLVCSGIYSWWQRSRRAAAAQETPAAVETAQAPPAAQPASPPPATEPAPAPAGGAPETPADAAERSSAERPAGGAAGTIAPPGEPARPSSATAPSAAAPSAAAPAAARPPGSEAAQAAPPRPRNPNASVRVEITASEPVWVLARSDGKYEFSGTLDSNQTRTVDAEGAVLLRLGNAGGVSITLNGKPLGAVGPKGQVRTVQLTSGGFQIVAAPKPSLPPADDRF
jgi:cytoskeleton protein RodZ